MTCHITTNVAGRCPCGQPMDPAHVLTWRLGPVERMEMCCVACCPKCKHLIQQAEPVEAVWDGEPVTIAGTQEGLW